MRKEFQAERHHERTYENTEEKASQRTPKRGQPSEEKGAIKQSEVV